jgi:hypothetical protein
MTGELGLHSIFSPLLSWTDRTDITSRDPLENCASITKEYYDNLTRKDDLS